ncbi:hypothetical protein DSO57_1024773 [Entomophthora muscae]|uniref:Uncharacterized protein n=1 Tax=Entomophthora muscae TaxID=34485 RepID=A0ACC2TQC7_9FUNG|nr:hypothetical protein DSO57_1024773 [Entomophthora muscae]
MANLIWNNFLPPANLAPTANQASAPLAQHPKKQIITAQILQEIVALNLQSLSWEQIAAQLQFTQATVMQEFNNLMNRRNLIGTAKKPKKAPKSQISEAYPIMLDLLQWNPKLPLTQAWKQLAHHNIWVSELMVQLWIHGKVTSIRVLTNFAGNQWDGTEDLPYDTTIESTLVQCLTSLTDDIMFVLYYKLSIAFDDFGTQGKAATQKGRNKVKKGTFLGYNTPSRKTTSRKKFAIGSGFTLAKLKKFKFFY